MIKNYNSFINEGLLKGKDPDRVKHDIKDKSPEDKLDVHIKYNIYTDDELKELLNDCSVYAKLKYISEYELKIFSDDELLNDAKEEYENVNDFNIFYWLYKIIPSSLRYIVDKAIEESANNYIGYIQQYVGVETEELIKILTDDEKIKLIIDLSDVKIIKIENDYYFTFEEVSELSGIVICKNDDYVENTLAYDNYYNHGLDYSGYDDVDEETLTELKEHILKVVTDEDAISELDNCSTLDNYYEFCREHDITDIQHAIDNAYSSAQSIADENEAYNDILNAIQKELNLDENFFTEHDGKMTWKINNIIDLIEHVDYNNNHYNNDNLDFKIKYDVPYNGINGDIEIDVFSEELQNKLYDL